MGHGSLCVLSFDPQAICRRARIPSFGVNQPQRPREWNRTDYTITSLILGNSNTANKAFV
jgi:hypothetical protein